MENSIVYVEGLYFINKTKILQVRLVSGTDITGLTLE